MATNETLNLADIWLRSRKVQDLNVIDRPFSNMDKASTNQNPIVIFISGHLDLIDIEFNTHYRPLINEALERGDSFIIGDARGCDAMSQIYLLGKTNSVVVYHMCDRPRNNAGFKTLGGFASDEDRDAQMTNDSDRDLAWVRPGRNDSGTQKNLDRRKKH